MIKRCETIEDFVRTTKQKDEVQTKHKSKDLTLSVSLRGTDTLSRGLGTYPVPTS